MTEHVFNWAFIGTGVLAKDVAKKITETGRHRIVSVYTRNYEKCCAFAQQYGALAAHTAEEAIGAPGVDGVYIVTPHTSHYEYAKQALLMGRPVLCEKPVSTDTEKTQELLRLSEERGVYFTEAMWTWFAPVANKVKEWLDKGEYGEVKKLHMTYHLRSINYAPRVSDPNTAGGALLDIGIYPLTYICRLFGKPQRIECRGKLRGGIDTGEDVAMYYPGGKKYTWSASILDFWGLEYMSLRGTKGSTTLFFYHGASKVTLRRRRGGAETFRGDGGYVNEFDVVASEIRQGLVESPLVPHKATLEVMQLMDECRRQMGLVYPFEKKQ